jgi:hypothetical protein
MRSVRLALALLLPVVLLASCADSGTVTAPAEIGAAHDGASGPSDRAIVIKDFGFASVLGGGPPTNLGITVAAEESVEDVCADPFSVPLSPQRGILVITPSGKVPAHVVTREAFVQVFEYSAGILTDFCQLVGAPLVATGSVFFSQSMNQFFGPGSGPGSFVAHVTVHGIVDLIGGGQARLHATVNFVIRPDGTVVKDQEPVTLTPL